MINAAIVGLGRWGQILVDSVQGKSDLIRFTRGVTRTPAKAAAFCDGHGIALGDDYDAALADPEIDAVVLATPHTRHVEQIRAAAAAGKHVFCEKPFTLTADDASAALDALAAANLKAGVGHNRRFSPNMRELKRLIEAGTLGDLLHIEGQFSANMAPAGGTWRDSRAESPAGGMTSLGIHLVDAYIYLMGRVADVRTLSKRVAIPYDIDDTTSVLMNFEAGPTGYLGTIAASATLWSVRVYGTQGWAEAIGHDRFECLMADGTSDRKEYPGYEYPGIATVKDELEAFARSATGDADPVIPPDEIVHGVAVMEAIFRSDERDGEKTQVT